MPTPPTDTAHLTRRSTRTTARKAWSQLQARLRGITDLIPVSDASPNPRPLRVLAEAVLLSKMPRIVTDAMSRLQLSQ